MRDYGRIKTTFWESETIRPLAPTTKFVAAYLLTSPHSNAIGCFRLPVAYVVHDTGMDEPDLQAALVELRTVGFLKWCERTPWIWIPNYLKHNPPENPNVWRKCMKEMQSLPTELSARAAIAEQLCEIALEERMATLSVKERGAIQALQTVVKRSANHIETVEEGCGPAHPLPCPIPCPEPNLTEPSQTKVDAAQAPPTPKPTERRARRWVPDEQIPPNWLLEAEETRAAHNLPPVNTILESQKFSNHWIAKSGKDATKTDWKRTWINWILNAKAEAKSNGKTDQYRDGIRQFLAGGSDPNPDPARTSGAGIVEARCDLSAEPRSGPNRVEIRGLLRSPTATDGR